MREITLTNKQFQAIPGRTTKKSVSYWKGLIFAMLDDLGVEEQGWIKDQNGDPVLVFSLDVNIGGIEKRVAFRMQPVLINIKKRVGNQYGPNKVIPMAEASWKLFHDLLERKIAAVKVGIVEAHHEFMSYIAQQLPDGSVGSLADVMDVVLEADRLNDVLQLEKKPEDVKVIDADYREG
ncbi:MAG: hypothetical protein ACTSWQ_11340 [Candidatus Thorarchaeota archaeon]